ncbi:hypothetical protein JCM19239_3237 [Vibrio variabilis]|uniref:Uncharacterized protein n=1 Tax=Vibrio variabilis TaxID=990271 RepID=A0ABQ0JIJ8_9VIBR|nr:hypothetical protein JCM19239_3237 [Vibrio variabilis]
MRQKTLAVVLLTTIIGTPAIAKNIDDKARPELPIVEIDPDFGQTPNPRLPIDVDPDFGVTGPGGTPEQPGIGSIDRINSDIRSNSTTIADNSSRIDSLEHAFKQQGEQMREQYDGVKASMHAITNARPIAYDVGAFAVGAGLGASGSKKLSL